MSALWLLLLPLTALVAFVAAGGVVALWRAGVESHRLDIEEERWAEEERHRRATISPTREVGR